MVVEEAVLISEAVVTPLILLAVEERISDMPESGVPPPPGFPPFVWPEDDGGMDMNDLWAQLSGDSSLTLSPISRESSDNSDVPLVGTLCTPLKDSSSEVIPAVGYAHLPLPW